jgi:hypothetical protein
MTREELLKRAKIRVRKSSTDMLDEDVSQLIDVALTDLKRIGVHQTYLDELEDPLVIEAVLNYVKANYSINSDYERLIGCYNMTLTKIKGGNYRQPKE